MKIIDQDWPAKHFQKEELATNKPKGKMFEEIASGIECAMEVMRLPRIEVIKNQLHIFGMNVYEVDELDQCYKDRFMRHGWFWDYDLSSWFYKGETYLVIPNYQ